MNTQSNSKNLDIEYAMDWISKNKGRIKSVSLRARMTSPYDMDDFTQAAYCVAMKIIEDFPRDRKNFGYRFWKSFWSELKEMTRRSVPTYVCSEGIEGSFKEPLIETNLENEQDEIENDAGAQDTIQIMAPRQMGVWQELLNPGRHTSRDVTGTSYRAARAAKCMGVRHTYVEKDRYRQVRRAE